MESHAKLFGHPIHQMLIVFPLGLLAAAVLCDLASLVSDHPMLPLLAWWLIGAGVIAGLIAAPFGTIDWLAIPAGTRAKRIGAQHGLGNLVLVLLFAISWWLRRDHPDAPGAAALTLSFAAGALSLLTAWLGGELVARLGVGVYPEAHLDAPSSLSRDRP